MARPRPSVQDGAAIAAMATPDPKWATSPTDRASPPPAIITHSPIQAPRTPNRIQVEPAPVHQSCQADPRRNIPAAAETRARQAAVHTQPAGTAPVGPKPRVVMATMSP